MAALDVPALSAVPVSDDEKALIAKFLVGYAALWVVLTAGAETKNFAGASAAFAVAIAAGATVLYLAKVTANLGLAGNPQAANGG